MITDLGKNKIANLVLGLVDHFEIRIDSVNEDVPILFQEVDDDRVVFVALVPEAFAGNIDRIRLIDTDDDVFAERIDSITKTSGNFVTLKFAYRITEEVIS
jgi:hypothetical protein